MQGQTHGGKGSNRRKPLVSQETVDKNYEAFLENNRKEREKAEKRANQNEKTD